MPDKKTVSINGRVYDAATGLPIQDPGPGKSAPKSLNKPKTKTPREPSASAGNIHSPAQRSKTLHRRAAKKVAGVAKRPKPGKHMDIAKSSHIKRFNSTAQAEKKAPVKESAPAPAKTHPVAAKANARQKAKVTPMTAKETKNAAISAALEKAEAPKKAPREAGFKWTRRKIITSIIIFVVLIGGLLTYVNLPLISVTFASSQAGISASYPNYRPDGYHLQQPITYSDGEVILNFEANSSRGDYSITQTRSSWDSSAVLENIVKPSAADNYVTTQEQGLTLYSYDGNTVWVNGGILYKLSVNAPLSGEQVRKIATSL